MLKKNMFEMMMTQKSGEQTENNKERGEEGNKRR